MKLILSIILAISSQAFATQKIEDLGIRIDQTLPEGNGQISASPVYALNNDLTGTVSSAVNLSAAAGVFINVTGTGVVEIQFSHVTYAAWAGVGTVVNGTVGFVHKRNQYVRFYNKGTCGTCRSTLAYTIPDNVGVMGLYPGSATLGTVNQGNAGTQNWFVRLSNTSNVAIVGGAEGLSVTATQGPAGSAPWNIQGQVSLAAVTWTTAISVSVTAEPAYKPVSEPAYTVLTGTATTVNLTSAAGVAANFDVALSGNYGANSFSRYKFTYSATAPSDIGTRGHYLGSTATSQIMGPFVPGTHLHIQAVGTGPTGNDVSVHLMQKLTSTANP